MYSDWLKKQTYGRRLSFCHKVKLWNLRRCVHRIEPSPDSSVSYSYLTTKPEAVFEMLYSSNENEMVKRVRNTCQFNLPLNPRLQPIHSFSKVWVSSSLQRASSVSPPPPKGGLFWKFNSCRKKGEGGHKANGLVPQFRAWILSRALAMLTGLGTRKNYHLGLGLKLALLYAKNLLCHWANLFRMFQFPIADKQRTPKYIFEIHSVVLPIRTVATAVISMYKCWGSGFECDWNNFLRIFLVT